MLSLPHKRTWLIVGWTLVLVIVVGSLIPHVPDLGAHVNDKVEHFSAYFGLTLWFCGLYVRREQWRVALTFFAMGGGLELAQGFFTTTRTMDWHDLLANSTGIVCALLLARLGLDGWARWIESWWIRLKR